MKTRLDIAALAALAALAVGGAAGATGCGSGDIADTSLGQATPPVAVVVVQTGGEMPPPSAPKDCIEPACQDIPLPPSTHLVRLTHAQWESTVRDLLRRDVATGLSSTFLPDPTPAAAEFGLDARVFAVDGLLWQQYRAAAEAAASLVVDDPVALDKLLPAAAKTGDTAARIRAMVEDFLPRAYRRPVLPAEIDAVIAHGEKVVFSDGTSDPFLLRARWILTATLQSPYFLYRVEGGEGVADKAGRYRLKPYELASKLSYALWGTMPDAALTAKAANGKLVASADIAAAVQEMLNDPRADAQLLDFHERFFLIDRYGAVTRQPASYPKFYPEFGADAQEDARATVRDLVIKNPGKVRDLYTSTSAFLNTRLAPIYGVDLSMLPGATPSKFVKVSVGPQRVGLLTHAGWLAFEGHAKDPSTIQRGAYLARRVLCISLGSPPEAAKGKDPANAPGVTNRQRVDATTSTCGSGCHTGAGGVINPLGFAFEGFDSLGQFRTQDNNVTIDSSGTIDEVGPFTDAASLMSKLADAPRMHACYIAHWSAYLNGRSTVDVVPKWLSPILQKSLAGASVRDLVTALVQTDSFLTVSRE